MKLGSKILAVLLLIVAVFLVNYLASRLPVRVDATSGGIYTLSSGTKSLLSKIEEPIVIDYYFSRDAAGLPISYKNYAARVQELLRQYVRASKGRLTLNVINPKPDTPEEERATSQGLQPQTIPTTGESVFFGIVAIQADQQKSIPALNPQREAFLEYDLSQLIHSVQQIEKPRLGLITSLPLRGQQPNMMMMMQQQQRGTPPQFIYNEWEKTFTLVAVEASATELPANLAALAVIHPQGLSEQLEFAIDQFLLSGSPVFLAVDPGSQHFRRQGGQMAMMGMPPQNVSSDLPRLLKAWGITYNAENVVGDLKLATPINTGRAVERYPVWLSLTRENLGATAQPTAQLNTLLFADAGSFTVDTTAKDKDGRPALDVIALAESSDQAGDVPGFTLQMAQPEDVAKQIIPTGKKLLAAQITGSFKTAFPEGAPKAGEDDKAGDAEAKPDAAAEKKTEADKKDAAAPKALAEGKSTLILVADTDWLFDDFSVRRFNFLGTEAAEPLNDNLSFGSNIVESLGGATDLISLRGKADANRPFTVVRDMEVAAQKKYQAKLSELEARLNEVQGKLSQLVGKSTEGNRLVATPEMQKAIDDFREQEVQMRRERREIRRSLREDIDALEYKLAALNLLAVPAAIVVVGLLFQRARRKR